jgi:hypothetical protein
MPIRSPRQLYRIPAIKEGEAADGTGGTDLFVKMKEATADWLGLLPVAYNDPALTGTFGGVGPNAGYKFRKRVGGYRDASYTLIAKTSFTINELILQDDGTYQVQARKFKSISIGFPKGHSVREFVNWIGGTTRINEVTAIVTPRGQRISVAPAT